MFEIRAKGTFRIQYQILSEEDVIKTYKYIDKVVGESLVVEDTKGTVLEQFTIHNQGDFYEFNNDIEKYRVKIGNEITIEFKNKNYKINQAGNIAILLEDGAPIAKISNYILSHNNLVKPYKDCDEVLIEKLLIIMAISEYKQFESRVNHYVNLFEV